MAALLIGAAGVAIGIAFGMLLSAADRRRISKLERAAGDMRKEFRGGLLELNDEVRSLRRDRAPDPAPPAGGCAAGGPTARTATTASCAGSGVPAQARATSAVVYLPPHHRHLAQPAPASSRPSPWGGGMA